MRKLTIVGAGSAMFTRGLVADAIRASRGRAWEIALVDIEPGILDAMRSLAVRMVEARERPSGSARPRIAGKRCRDRITSSSRSAWAAGGAWERDVLIPREYGVYQPVGDSVLPGGISRALRMIPALVEIVRDAAALCPGRASSTTRTR